jgi:hypothetical protein
MTKADAARRVVALLSDAATKAAEIEHMFYAAESSIREDFKGLMQIDKCDGPETHAHDLRYELLGVLEEFQGISKKKVKKS